MADDVDQTGLNDFDRSTMKMRKRRELKMSAVGPCERT